MFLLERLFSANYFIFIKQRKFHKKLNIRTFDIDEDFAALCMLIASQILVIGILMAIYKRNYGFTMPPSAGIIFLVLYVFLTFIQYKYLISNRERRRNIIETYRALSKQQKTAWTILSIATLIIPIIMFPIIL